MWSDNPEKLIEGITDNIIETLSPAADKRPLVREEVAKMIRSFIFYFSEISTFGLIKRVSQAVGTPRLEITYDKLVDQKNSPSIAIRLIDASVRLDIGKISTNQISRLHSEMKDNVFADRILKHLVVHYFRLFHTEYKVRQSLCDTLGIPISVARREALLTQDAKRFQGQA